MPDCLTEAAQPSRPQSDGLFGPALSRARGGRRARATTLARSLPGARRASIRPGCASSPRPRISSSWRRCVASGFEEPRTFASRAADEKCSNAPASSTSSTTTRASAGLLKLRPRGWPVLASIHHPITVDRRPGTRPRHLAAPCPVDPPLVRLLGDADRVARRLPLLLTVSESRRHRRRDGGRRSAAFMSCQSGSTPPSSARSARWREPGRIITTASADVPLKGLVPLLEALAKLGASSTGRSAS